MLSSMNCGTSSLGSLVGVMNRDCIVLCDPTICGEWEDGPRVTDKGTKGGWGCGLSSLANFPNIYIRTTCWDTNEFYTILNISECCYTVMLMESILWRIVTWCDNYSKRTDSWRANCSLTKASCSSNARARSPFPQSWSWISTKAPKMMRIAQEDKEMRFWGRYEASWRRWGEEDWGR